MATVLKVLVQLILSVTVVNCLPLNATKTLYKHQSYEWDHFVLAQQHPAGICYYNENIGKGYTCSYPSNATTWTVHGLWPTEQSSKGPNFCDKTPFDLSRIYDLIPRLIMEWTNLLNETSFASFWDHEWCKHGTCSGMDIHAFFSTVLKTFEQFQFGKHLAQYNITPGNDYEVDEIVTALNKSLGVEPHLTCLYSKSCGQILKQIHICLDKQYNPIECPESTNFEGNCRDSEPVHYVQSMYSKK